MLGQFIRGTTISGRKPGVPRVDKIMALLRRLGEADYEKNYADAKARSSCIICGRQARNFRSAAAKLEYSVSALCQKCQDEYLNGGTEYS